MVAKMRRIIRGYISSVVVFLWQLKCVGLYEATSRGPETGSQMLGTKFNV